MRYLLPMTDFALQPALTEQMPAEARLVAALTRPRRIALACILTLTALGWIALGLLATRSEAARWSWGALCQPNAAGGWSGFVLTVAMWIAMTLAMMLPTAGPMILTYAEIAETAARKGERIVSPLVLTAGYVAVWLGSAFEAASLQWTLANVAPTELGNSGALLAGAIVLVAGLYQFTPLKRACLTKCQRPFPFFFANWTTERIGVLRLGLRQGIYCLGCCWAMMAIMFAAGAMNVVWMAALGVVMTVEKVTSTPRFSQIVGIVLAAHGAAMIVVAAL
jgi:predicted metal-binding membrane protein